MSYALLLASQEPRAGWFPIRYTSWPNYKISKGITAYISRILYLKFEGLNRRGKTRTRPNLWATLWWLLLGLLDLLRTLRGFLLGHPQCHVHGSLIDFLPMCLVQRQSLQLWDLSDLGNLLRLSRLEFIHSFLKVLPWFIKRNLSDTYRRSSCYLN